MGQMPRPAIGVRRRIGRLAERAVHRLPVGQLRRAIRGRAHEGMPEPHLSAELDEPRVLGRSARVGRDAESLGCAPHQVDVADRLRRSNEQQAPGLGRQ